MEAQVVARWPLVQLEVWDSDHWGRDYFVGQAVLDLTQLVTRPTPAPLNTVLPLVQVDEVSGRTESGLYGQLAVTAWLGQKAVAGSAGVPPASTAAGTAAASLPGSERTAAAQQAAASASPSAPQAMLGVQGTEAECQTQQGTPDPAPAPGPEQADQGRRLTAATLSNGAVEGGTEQDGFVVSSLLVRSGLPKGLPLVSHSQAGTLYEEPCLRYIRLQASQGGPGAGQVAVQVTGRQTSKCTT
ncbi:PRT_C domain-containing protein [Haematococcus lacustris]|uniref:PRT_C domain-containing protein n=1 Tax=Haematococcus lacustris TaxID=44745 RepID=A0A699Y678_HAELA|nr:PRT_C domain-containing protein [Haematococcus lacustris]